MVRRVRTTLNGDTKGTSKLTFVLMAVTFSSHKIKKKQISDRPSLLAVLTIDSLQQTLRKRD